MDLQGETTTITDIAEILSLERKNSSKRDKIIVFNGAETADENIGWGVDEVARVSIIDIDDVEQTDEATLSGPSTVTEDCSSGLTLRR